MFGVPVLEMSTQVRTGGGMWWSECLATFGLVGLAMATARTRPASVPFVVAGYITAGYWFTSSTSFANPALTLACALTDTFAGIRPGDVPAFVLAQIGGALVATGCSSGCARRSVRQSVRSRACYQRRLSCTPKIEPLVCVAQASAGVANVMPSTSLARL